MGLDIYGHHTHIPFEGDQRSSEDIRAFTEKVDEAAKEKLGKELRKAIEPLRKLWNDAHFTNEETGQVEVNNWRLSDYNTAYFEFVTKVLKPAIAKNYNFKISPYTKGVMDFPDLETAIEKEIDMAYEEYDMYYRKVNFLFAYFQNNGKMVDEWFAFVDKEDVDDIIDRCERVLKDHNLASELLPTQSGFFFGSTEFNEWYFSDVRDCLKQMKKYRKLLKEGVTGYMVFSW